MTPNCPCRLLDVTDPSFCDEVRNMFPDAKCFEDIADRIFAIKPVRFTALAIKLAWPRQPLETSPIGVDDDSMDEIYGQLHPANTNGY